MNTVFYKLFQLPFPLVTILLKGPFINYVDKPGGGGLAKCLGYYISLCSKLVCGGGRGVKNLQNPVYVVYEQPQM